jgi:hypothetical protein
MAKLYRKSAALFHRGVYPELERLANEHLLTLLICDVLLDGLQGHRSTTGDELAPGPQARQPSFEPGELLAERVRRVPLDPSNDLVHPDAGIARDEQVDMVRHDFHIQDFVAIVLLFFKDQFLETFIEAVLENLTSILRAKHNMVLAGVDDRISSLISLGRLLDLHIPPPIDEYMQFYNRLHVLSSSVPWLKRAEADEKPLYPGPKAPWFYGLAS